MSKEEPNPEEAGKQLAGTPLKTDKMLNICKTHEVERHTSRAANAVRAYQVILFEYIGPTRSTN